jgi:hypothetical protein
MAWNATVEPTTAEKRAAIAQILQNREGIAVPWDRSALGTKQELAAAILRKNQPAPADTYYPGKGAAEDLSNGWAFGNQAIADTARAVPGFLSAAGSSIADFAQRPFSRTVEAAQTGARAVGSLGQPIVDMFGMVADDVQGSVEGAKRMSGPGGYVSPDDAMIGDTFNAAMDTMVGGGLPAAATRKGSSLGTFGGRMAKNAPLDDLARAEAMEQAGANADDIWKSTGWGKGADGKWRFEIDDSAAALHRDGLKLGTASHLEDVMKHDELYKAYPDTKGIYTTIEQAPRPSGFWRPKEDRSHLGLFDIDEQIGIEAPAIRETRKSLGLHEVTHGLQSREGFARGGAPSTSGTINPQATASAYDEYYRLAGEAEARNVQKRMNMTQAERRATPPWSTEDVPRSEQIVRMGSDGPQASSPLKSGAGEVVDLGSVRKTRADDSLRSTIKNIVETHGDDAVRRGFEYNAAGKLPLPLGTRILPPGKSGTSEMFNVSAHYVDPNKPSRYGYTLSSPSGEKYNLIINDPRVGLKDNLTGWKPMTGPVGLDALKSGADDVPLPMDEASRMARAGGVAEKPQIKSFKRGWRGEEAQYDPRYYDIQPDALIDDAGKTIATRDKLVPKNNLQYDIPVTEQDGVIYRGMSAAEYDDFVKTGRIQSSGSYNIGDEQKGLTYFSTSPRSAANYSSSFAPAEHKAKFDKPAYVVAVRSPDQSRIRKVAGTGEHEIGVQGPISGGDVVGIYRGNVVQYTPEVREKGFYSAPSASLHWEKLDTPQPMPRVGLDTIKSGADDVAPRKFYRGTTGGTERIKEPFSEAKGLTFVARKPESARMYGNNIEEITATPAAKILDDTSPEFWRLVGRRRPPNGFVGSARGGTIEVVNDAVKKAKAAGYDAVSFSSDADIGTVILNENAFTRGASSPLKSGADDVGGTTLAAGGNRKAGAGYAAVRDKGAKSLPMDEASRMARAREMGVNDTDLYHATTESFDEFDLSKAGLGTTISGDEKAVFLTTKPSVAGEFVAYPWTLNSPEAKAAYGSHPGEIIRPYATGANIMPLRLRVPKGSKWTEIDLGGAGYDSNKVASEIKAARKAKEPFVIFKNMRDPGFSTPGQGEVSHIVAVLDPSLLRSKFAAFDPSKSDSTNILAAGGNRKAGAGYAAVRDKGDEGIRARDRLVNSLSK